MVKDDFFLDQNNAYDRLFHEYAKHKSIIVACDFDNTIYDYHKKGLKFPKVIETLKRCNEVGFRVVIFTGNKDHKLVRNHCKKIGVKIEGININLIPNVSHNGKIFANVLLDDRAGLSSAHETLTNLLDIVEIMEDDIEN